MAKKLRDLLGAAPITVAPGIFDALSALIASKVGFSCCYLSGASVAYTRFASPDVGLVTMNEMVDTLSAITERVELPLIVDGDNGYGNALNVQRTVRYFERAGAAAIQLEDQSFPKRCGHLAGKSLVSPSEMVGKIHAALDARDNPDTMIIARTDAIQTDGFDAAMERAAVYVDAGADMLFVEAPRTVDQLGAIPARFSDKIPVMANMVEGGDTPIQSATQLATLGFCFAIFPGALVRYLARQSENFLTELFSQGSTVSQLRHMHDLSSLNELIETPSFLARGKRYGSDIEEN